MRRKNKNKSILRKYGEAGLGSIGSVVTVGSIPNISGTTAETNIKTQFAYGMGNVGKTFPTIGKIAGTEIVFKSVNKLKKSSKKLMKGGKKKRW